MNSACARAEGERVENDPSSHPVWRDEIAALKCTQRLVGIAREVGAKIHILHLSTAEEVDFLIDHKDVASIEVTPHHLTLTDEAYHRLGNFGSDEPPGARTASFRAPLVGGLSRAFWIFSALTTRRICWKKNRNPIRPHLLA